MNMNEIPAELANLRRSMMFFAGLKVLLLFVGTTGLRISNVAIEIGPNFDRIIFLITMIIGWKTAFFLYASGGFLQLMGSTNHVVSAFFTSMPILACATVFVLGYGTWLPIWPEFWSIERWDFRSMQPQ
jgi:hypothetical protein